jgi:predicted dehydrogenase
MGKLKFGVVGCGGQGSGWARYLAKHKDAELVALCDIDAGKLNAVKKATGCQYGTQNFDEFIEQKLDAIVNACPHYLHADYSIKAMENDINVFVEKPMAITLQQCDEMIKTAKQNDVKLQVGHQRRFGKAEMKIKKALDAGVIGNIFHMNLNARWYRTEVYFVTSSPVREEDGGKHWRGRWKTEGGSALINQTVHLIDLFRWFGGEIKDIQASAHTCLHEFIETEDNVGAVINFQNGAIGTLQCGVVYEKESDRIEIFGTKGKIKFDENGLSIKGEKSNDSVTEEEEPGEAGARPIMDNFIAAINDDEPLACDGYQGRNAIEVIRGIYMSVMNNGKVSFPVCDNGCFPRLPNYYKPEY